MSVMQGLLGFLGGLDPNSDGTPNALQRISYSMNPQYALEQQKQTQLQALMGTMNGVPSSGMGPQQPLPPEQFLTRLAGITGDAGSLASFIVAQQKQKADDARQKALAALMPPPPIPPGEDIPPQEAPVLNGVNPGMSLPGAGTPAAPYTSIPGLQTPQTAKVPDSQLTALQSMYKMAQVDHSLTDNYMTALNKYNDTKEKNADSIITPDNEALSGQGKKFIDTIPDADVRNKALALLEGRAPYPNITSRTPNNIKKALEAAQAADQSYSAQTYPVRLQAFKNFSPGGKGNQVIQNLNTLGGHIADANDLLDKLPDHYFTAQNWIEAKLATKTKNKLHDALNQFHNLVVNNIGPEGAKIASGTGEATDRSAFANTEGMDPSQGRSAIKATLQSKAQAVADRASAMIESYRQIYNDPNKIPPGFKPFTKKTIDSFAKLGVELKNPDFSDGQSEKDTSPTPEDYKKKYGL